MWIEVGTNKNANLKMVKDPYGNEIVIHPEMTDFTKQIKSRDEILDDIATVIEKPAMMFKINGAPIQLYYMRAISWNKIVLVCAQKKHDQFEVTNCEVDPSAKKLSELYHWADQLI
jgi:hypothetical protein